MELIQPPRAMRNRGFTGWPEIYRVGKHEELPPVGVSYLIAEKVDFPLIFRIMVPLLIKQHPFFNWSEIYRDLIGKPYLPQRVYRRVESDGYGSAHFGSTEGVEEVTLEELAGDTQSYVDIGVLEEMAMIPVFMTDIREAITANVTNSFTWTDGYNKKTGICSGFLTEQPQAKSLIILDISSSIPDGVSAGMMTLISTMTDIVNADLILTGGKSYFYTRDEARVMDIHAERARIPRSNESQMFREILMTHDMDYENIITFGDSDWPGDIELEAKLDIKRWYSFFTMTYDTYGNPASNGAGYGRWIPHNVPTVQVIHNTDWARYFTKELGRSRPW